MVPEGLTDEDVLFLTDALPTGFEMGILNGNTKPGDTVAVIGAGPVGLGAIMTANLCGAGRVITVDMDDNRMNKALELGATDKVNAADPDFIEKIKALSSDGLGVDVAIEAVGVPQTFETCTKIVRPYGNIANAGVHGKPVELPINTMWISNVNINMGLVNCNTRVRNVAVGAHDLGAGLEGLRHAHSLNRHIHAQTIRGEGLNLLDKVWIGGVYLSVAPSPAPCSYGYRPYRR